MRLPLFYILKVSPLLSYPKKRVFRKNIEYSNDNIKVFVNGGKVYGKK